MDVRRGRQAQSIRLANTSSAVQAIICHGDVPATRASGRTGAGGTRRRPASRPWRPRLGRHRRGGNDRPGREHRIQRHDLEQDQHRPQSGAPRRNGSGAPFQIRHPDLAPWNSSDSTSTPPAISTRCCPVYSYGPTDSCDRFRNLTGQSSPGPATGASATSGPGRTGAPLRCAAGNSLARMTMKTTLARPPGSRSWSGPARRTRLAVRRSTHRIHPPHQPLPHMCVRAIVPGKPVPRPPRAGLVGAGSLRRRASVALARHQARVARGKAANIPTPRKDIASCRAAGWRF